MTKQWELHKVFAGDAESGDDEQRFVNPVRNHERIAHAQSEHDEQLDDTEQIVAHHAENADENDEKCFEELELSPRFQSIEELSDQADYIG